MKKKEILKLCMVPKFDAWCQNSPDNSHSATHAQCIKNECNVSVSVVRSADLRMAYVISRVQGLTW
jgi:hypothetical protein